MSSLSILIDSLYTHKTGCDVTFVANDGSWHEFHRDIIGQHSPVIKAMLESDEKKMEIPFDYNAEVLEIVRNYVYMIPPKHRSIIVVWDVWRFAYQYDMQIYLKIIDKILVEQIDTISIDMLYKLITVMENLSLNTTLQSAAIARYTKYMTLVAENNQPCDLYNCPDINKKCCKCNKYTFGSGEQKDIICAEKFCCQYRKKTIDPVVYKKQVFDKFAIQFLTFKPETQIKILCLKFLAG